jgi:hypothetical protein
LSGEPDQEEPGLSAKAFVLAFTVPFGVTLALVVWSFPVGLYTAFYTTLTPGVNASTPVPFYFWLGPLPVRTSLAPPLGVLFAVMTAVYAAMFCVAALRGAGFPRAFSEGMRRGPGALLSSDLVVVLVAMGFLTFAATAVDSLTQALGGQIGALNGTDATLFISTTTSPFIEEFGFRACIIGAVALVLQLGAGWRECLRALWRPGSAYEGGEAGAAKEYMVMLALAASSAVFGLAHIASGAGWELGKLPEATVGGLILGYVYVRYGFHAAVIAHWGIDYLGTVYAFFGQGAFGIPWGSDPGYALQQVVTADLVAGIGAFSFVLVIYLGVRRLRTAAGARV